MPFDIRKKKPLNDFCSKVWLHFFKKPLDTLSYDWEKVFSQIREFYFKCEWFEVYDLIEFTAQTFTYNEINKAFVKMCNTFLEKEVSAYRFVDLSITRIISETEISEIEEALETKNDPVRDHLKRSLEMLSDRKNPDYRNSIKEAISSVEAIVQLVTGSEKGTLGKLLNEIEKVANIHPALKSAFNKLYGYTSDANGIRHALLEGDRATFEEAKFMLVACSAFTNYVNGLLKK